MPTFQFNTCKKTRAKLPDCSINNALIQFVPSCLAVSKAGKFSDIACSILMLRRGDSYAKTETKFCCLALGGPVIMPHRACVSTATVRLADM